MAFAHAQVIDRIEQVGLAHAVEAGHQVEFLGKRNCLMGIVAEIGEL